MRKEYGDLYIQISDDDSIIEIFDGHDKVHFEAHEKGECMYVDNYYINDIQKDSLVFNDSRSFEEFVTIYVNKFFAELNERIHLFCNDVSIDDKTGRGFEVESTTTKVVIEVFISDQVKSVFTFVRSNNSKWWTLKNKINCDLIHFSSNCRKSGKKGYSPVDIINFVRWISDTFECKDLNDQSVEIESHDYSDESEEDSHS